MDIRKYQPVKRTTPIEIKSVEREQDLLMEEFSKSLDLVWILARMDSVENSTVQTVPAWTGFNYLISPDGPNDFPDKVVHLPSINKSPAEMATVNEVLRLVKAKADALQLTEIDLVFDHAIYGKAFEIIRNPVDGSLKNAINLRMGGFHVECIFLSVISKRFLDGGIKGLVIEALLLEEGSTISALPSPHYSKAMRIHKYVYEAFVRCKIQSFEEWLAEVNDASSPIT